MQKITPSLWFDGNAEDAANFYISLFKRSKILDVVRYGEAGMGQPGDVMTVSFELEGQEYVAINGGPMYSFTPAISFAVSCEKQQEIDELWQNLLDGGQPLQCGWITDRYGVTWQVVPSKLPAMLSNKNRAKSKAVTEAMLKMVKLDLPELEKAFNSA